MKIAIRADGGNKIGMGHIMRTLVLAKELAKTNYVFYICRDDNPLSDKYKSGIEKINGEGFNIITIDESNILDKLKDISADCLITDSYDVEEEYFNKTKKLFKLTGYIDDMNLYNFNVDFIINQNIGAEEFKYKVDKDTKLFLGTKYTMLREEFRNTPIRSINKDVSDIMLTLGGSDVNGITNTILDYIKDLQFNFHVVVGPSFEEHNIENLKKIEGLKSNIKLYFNPNMIEIMNKCDITISACGSTLYELSSLGVPTIGVIIADNQANIAKKMEKENLILNLGFYNSLKKEDFINSINFLMSNYLFRVNMSKNQQKIINKNGVSKLAYEINNKFKNRIK
ncbi:MAG: UDP-2,4-diacetamido-2,4,6-trideoxy-beta-L-altropyranose hydrolase [Clostridium botulinum]|uniref:UDP-2,4-diacetamido-2,4, 6-trideoxy-beta-L-altropyranose hydrolase n=1 Tax=Clostridium sporogenes TaxID=1509 RepID=UPI0022390152|nr:UDP-2,4-diacetamido-2,4,6-trideoxy-beta-L-altropyranose hydrolase [Clostridium sporogenes]MCW6110457.1 UDP-2,4-diacetamido-2,4,6-trideoxy-beta-L-altropyranose hydrolase [Clostridium sporogenes]MDU1323242.1 UDP-2,4-diacetamido-2,4,6-trideoxy-beta-L-altropyranose hydrolase [Clostridium botulinum]